MKLKNDWREAKFESIRHAFGESVLQLAKDNQKIVVLGTDLADSVGFGEFAKKYQGSRYIEVGVAEQNLVTIASGLAHAGKTPFATGYSAFSPGRNWEQIRTTICLNNQPVIIVGSHAGLNVGPDGATHQMLEDIAMMRVLPNMTVFAPGDITEARNLVSALVELNSPAYVRLPREKSPSFLMDRPFTIGKAMVLRAGEDVVLFGTGTMSYQLLLTADILESQGVSAEVVHIPTIKPLAEDAIIASARKCGRVVTIEEAQIAGGFGSAITELLSEKLPMPVKRIGVNDQFGQSGKAQELMEHYGLTSANIAKLTSRYIEQMPQYHRQ